MRYEFRRRVPLGTTHWVVPMPLRGTGAHRHDGTTHVVFEPLVFLERLAALVPPPRMQLQPYYGMLAPCAASRDELVPKVARSSSGHEDAAPPEREPGVSPRPPNRYLWAELMRASSVWMSCAAGCVALIADWWR